MLITLIAILLLLAVSGFFSGSETAVTGASRPRIYQRQKNGEARANTLTWLWGRGEQMLSSILVGNNLVNIMGTALATALFTDLFGPEGVAIATLVMTVLVVVFAEVLPKTVALRYSDAIALRVAPILRLVVIVLSPITWLVSVLVRGILALFGGNGSGQDDEAREEELRGSIDLLAETEGASSDTPDAAKVAEREMLRSILDLDEITVEEVMTHRGKVETANVDLPAKEIFDQVMQSPHTRIPLWEGDSDNIVGVLHAKNLLRALAAVDGDPTRLNIREIMKQPWFVPETAQLDEQLRAFRRQRAHFAVVVDEYGGLMGIITLEDILEEIVGDIADEHDLVDMPIRRGREGSFVAEGQMTIRDVNRHLGWQLPDDKATTLAGLILYESRQIPSVGQVFVFFGMRWEIMEMNKLQIAKLRITPGKG